MFWDFKSAKLVNKQSVIQYWAGCVDRLPQQFSLHSEIVTCSSNLCNNLQNAQLCFICEGMGCKSGNMTTNYSFSTDVCRVCIYNIILHINNIIIIYSIFFIILNLSISLLFLNLLVLYPQLIAIYL